MKKTCFIVMGTIVSALCLTAFCFAQETAIVGKWKTIDDKTNEPKSIVMIYEKDGNILAG